MPSTKALMLCQHDLEYADCILCKGVRSAKNSGALRKVLNWWWGSSCQDLGSVDYPFIVTTPRHTLT